MHVAAGFNILAPLAPSCLSVHTLIIHTHGWLQQRVGPTLPVSFFCDPSAPWRSCREALWGAGGLQGVQWGLLGWGHSSQYSEF